MKGKDAPPPAADFATPPAVLSPGMASLLRQRHDEGTNTLPTQLTLVEAGPEATQTTEAEPIPGVSTEPATPRRPLQVALVLGDVLLLLLAARLAWGAHGPLGIIGIVLCVAAVATGAWLACLAIWLE
jgi:hypothetical protein